MARVYKAHQVSLNRDVAIKFLSAEHLWNDDIKNLFEQESLVIAQLNHPNIIHIIDRGISDKGRPYFVMEYVSGDDLSQLIKQDTLSIRKKADIVIQLSKGMGCAHKNGVIHRDIKPANIIVDAEGQVKVLDFGIAWLAASGHPEDIVGTPDYMSPEQFNAPESVTCLSDIYSLGIIMYELFLNKLPTPYFDDLLASMTSLPDKLAELINECLSTDVAQRPASVDEVGLRLLKIMQGAHINSRQKAEAENVVGNKKGKFAFLDVIKRTSFGAVYLFEDKTKNTLFVIKKHIKTESGFVEANKLSKIKHNSLIKILGTSKNNNVFIVVMEHLTGGSLQDRLSRKYTPEKFKPIALSICDAMHMAYKHKITHGDLRPSNILFDENDQVKVTDFGFDGHYPSNRQQRAWYQSDDILIGDFDKDLYSAGAIFYHMLTGVPVKFEHGCIQTDLLFNKLDPRLRKVLRNMMESESKGHYKSFKQARLALKKIIKNDAYGRDKSCGQYQSKKQLGLKHIVILIALISVVAVLAYFYMHQSLWFELLKKISGIIF